MSSPGLTSADKKALRDIAENGPWKYAKHAGGRTATDVLDNDTRPPDVSYRGGDGRRGITLEMCNAIREAARDRYTYREIRDLFGFVGHEKTAHVHATGRCVHGHGDIPPVPPARDPGHRRAASPKRSATGYVLGGRTESTPLTRRQPSRSGGP